MRPAPRPVWRPARRAWLRTLLATALVLLVFATLAHAQQRSLTRQGFDSRPVQDGVLVVVPMVETSNESASLQRERSRAGRVVLEFLASSAGAAGAGLVGFLIFQDVGRTRVEGDAGYTRAGNVAYLTGSVAGATLGAQLVGRSMGARSPWWATATGALIGTVPLFAVLGVDEPYLPLFGILLGWIPQAAFATIGYEAAATRR